MKNTNVILYTAGAYGSFICWCCSYFSGLISDRSIPLTTVGTVHNSFPGVNPLFFPSQFEEYMKSDKDLPFIQLHETSVFNDSDYQKFVKENVVDVLNYLNNNFSKTIYVYPTDTSINWLINNQYFKIRPFEDYIRLGITNDPEEYLISCGAELRDIEKLKKFGVDRLRIELSQQVLADNLIKHGHTSIDGFDLWQLRELSSEYFYDSKHAQLSALATINQSDFKNICFVRLDTLRDNFVECLTTILNYFDISNTNVDDMNIIYNQWIVKQKYINADQQIDKIVNALINNIELEWETYKLTFFDEIAIQRKLLDNNIKIKCYNLNQFPTNTRNFLPLLERV